MDALLERHGAAAYGMYWLVVEDIAAAMDSQKPLPEATHSERKWCEITHLDRRIFRKLLQDFRAHLMQVSESQDGRIRICVPNVLKYKDEYARKSGHSPHKLPGRADDDESTTDEQQTTTTFAAITSFFPDADAAIAQRIAAAARRVCPEATDAEIAAAVRQTHKASQQSAGLWLTTVPAFLRNGAPKSSKARDGSRPACERCGDTGLTYKPGITEQPRWTELPESELYEPCECGRTAKGTAA